MLTIADEYRAGKTAGILAATDRDPERRHTTREEAARMAEIAKYPAIPQLGTEQRRRNRAYWLGYLRGVREWHWQLREIWQQLRRDGTTAMSYEEYLSTTSRV